MSELNLIIFGCAVTFIAVGGAYIYIREQYLASDLPNRKRPRPPSKQTQRAHRVRMRENAA